MTKQIDMSSMSVLPRPRSQNEVLVDGPTSRSNVPPCHGLRLPKPECTNTQSPRHRQRISMTQLTGHEMPHDTSNFSLGPQRRTKKVTAEHTLERVRNNQRNHRARRREYIASLEDKLSEVEAALAGARDEIVQLRSQIERCHHPDHVSLSNSTSAPAQLDAEEHGPGGVSPPLISMNDSSGAQLTEHILPDDANFTTFLESPVAAPTSRPHDLVGPTKDPFCYSTSSPYTSESTPTPPSSLLNYVSADRTEPSPSCHTNTVSGAEGGDLMHSCSMGTKCCSNDVLTTALPSDIQTVQHVEYQAPTVLPVEVLQAAAMEVRFREHEDSESTTPCADAYVLISQQNFKGLSPQTIQSWLWEGFRRARQPGEGCRVQNALLFSLLAFISDS